ncbi:transposase [Catenulispora sp. NL8]|uniref:Transposase n=1 Tax=Catenulispora pinistramenti TaxID=2705254 RepID=A0ABS5KKY8_9ACTN|nr:transposase [Catenulispora pinistramenti]
MVPVLRGLRRVWAGRDGTPGHEVETWWPQIEAAIRTGMNNAGSEGTNRVIKTDARAAFGYRNPANQRLRARCTTTRRSRGHLSTRTSGRHGQLR